MAFVIVDVIRKMILRFSSHAQTVISGILVSAVSWRFRCSQMFHRLCKQMSTSVDGLKRKS